MTPPQRRADDPEDFTASAMRQPSDFSLSPLSVKAAVSLVVGVAAIISAAFALDARYHTKAEAQAQYQEVRRDMRRTTLEVRLSSLELRSALLEREAGELERLGSRLTASEQQRFLSVRNELRRIEQQTAAIQRELALLDNLQRAP